MPSLLRIPWISRGCSPATYKAKTDSQTQRTELWLSRGRKGQEGEDCEFGISRCKLLYSMDKHLWYSTGTIFNIL